MIIVDDRLALAAASGRIADRVPEAEADTVATTWGFHYRLVRALTDHRREGALSRMPGSRALAQVAAPPAGRLVVLDPRSLTVAAAAIAVRHGLNLLASELVAAAVHHRANVFLSEANVGRRWERVFEEEAVELVVVED